MYEVGLAHGLSRNVLLIRDAATEIPFDVKDIMALTYERVTLYRLQKDLTERFHQIAAGR
jgi:hypothetical protein